MNCALTKRPPYQILSIINRQYPLHIVMNFVMIFQSFMGGTSIKIYEILDERIHFVHN